MALYKSSLLLLLFSKSLIAFIKETCIINYNLYRAWYSQSYAESAVKFPPTFVYEPWLHQQHNSILFFSCYYYKLTNTRIHVQMYVGTVFFNSEVAITLCGPGLLLLDRCDRPVWWGRAETNGTESSRWDSTQTSVRLTQRCRPTEQLSQTVSLFLSVIAFLCSAMLQVDDDDDDDDL